MSSKPIGAIATILAICCLFHIESCSVKEDRDDCPCHLALDFSRVPDEISDKAILLLKSSDGFSRLDTLSRSAGFDDAVRIFETDVPRKAMGLFIIAGGMLELLPSGASIPEGMDCPDTYLMSKKIDARCDSLAIPVIMHKSYCRLSIHLQGGNAFPRGYGFGMVGNATGYDYDGSPLICNAGFSYFMNPDVNGDCSVCLPRQADSSLMLEIKAKGTVLRTFAIGEFIAESGYDWDKEDLEDLDVDIDYANTGIRFSIGLWEKTFNYELVI